MTETAKRTVLIVEDNEDFLGLMEFNFEARTDIHIVDFLTTLPQAEAAIKEIQPGRVDVVLLDDKIQGTSVTGILAEQIRLRDSQVTIIGTSSNPNIYNENSGIDGYLDKCAVWIPGRIESIIDARKRI